VTAWLATGILFGGLIVGLLLALPMAFTLASSAIITALFVMGPNALALFATNIWAVMVKLSFVAIPLFIFMACMLEKIGVAEALYDAMHQWLGSLRGGLAMGTVIICTVIAAMSGVVATGVVTMGIIALPIMLQKKYSKSIAIGPILAGGALGTLIPPSVSFIIYGVLTKTSIGRLFAGGLIPGLVLSSLYLSYIAISCWLKPELAPALPKAERSSFKGKVASSRGLILPILLITAVLGSIFAGIASPTESAAVGAFGAILCGVVHRKLSWSLLKETCYRAILVSGMVMWIMFGAFCFTSVFISTGGPEIIKGFILGLELSPISYILMMMLSYFILGCLVDETTMLFVTIPVYMPILISLGFDPVWFGVLFIISMQIAYLTPPFGWSLFYMRGVAPPTVKISDIYRSILPFIGLQWIGLLLVLFFPQLALWLPDIVFGLK